MNETEREAIETRLAYAEHSVSELSDLVYAQSQALDRLSERLRIMEQRASAGDDAETESSDEKPPHY